MQREPSQPAQPRTITTHQRFRRPPLATTKLALPRQQVQQPLPQVPPKDSMKADHGYHIMHHGPHGNSSRHRTPFHHDLMSTPSLFTHPNAYIPSTANHLEGDFDFEDPEVPVVYRGSSLETMDYRRAFEDPKPLETFPSAPLKCSPHRPSTSFSRSESSVGRGHKFRELERGVVSRSPKLDLRGETWRR